MYNIKKFYIEYLIEQVKNSTFIKEHATTNEYERFKKWIKNLDYETVRNILKEGKIEDIVAVLVQGKGKEVPGLSGKSKRAKEIIIIAIEEAEKECKKRCGEDIHCFHECLIDKQQHMIGSLKTEKDKCSGWNKQRCYDRFDKAIEFISNKTEDLVRQHKGK